MDYKSTYEKLISKALEQNRVKGRGFEAHHILPVCMGGEGKYGDIGHSNIVLLTYKEHFIAHKLLWKMYPEVPELAYAFWFMVHNPREKNLTHLISSREYSKLKMTLSEEMSIRMSGRPSFNKGLRCSWAEGENNVDSILTNEKVTQIRNEHINYTFYELSEKYGVSSTTIKNVVYGKAWKHLPMTSYQQELLEKRIDSNGRVDKNRPQGEKTALSKLTETKVRWAKIYYIHSHPEYGLGKISKKFGVHLKTLLSAIDGITWKMVVLTPREQLKRNEHLKNIELQDKIKQDNIDNQKKILKESKKKPDYIKDVQTGKTYNSYHSIVNSISGVSSSGLEKYFFRLKKNQDVSSSKYKNFIFI